MIKKYLYFIKVFDRQSGQFHYSLPFSKDEAARRFKLACAQFPELVHTLTRKRYYEAYL